MAPSARQTMVQPDRLVLSTWLALKSGGKAKMILAGCPDVLDRMWMFPKIGVPQNGWFIRENPIKMDDLGGTPIFGNTHVDFLVP